MLRAFLIGNEPGVPLGYTYVEAPPYDGVVIGSLTLGQLLHFSQEPVLTALAEGKLLSAFGQPEYTSENCENSFNYIIRATADNEESVILTVYGMGIVHIGAAQRDDFAKKAAVALIEHVNSFAPTDYSRTVYYLDFDMQIDIQVKGGKATITQAQISEDKANELFDKFYK